MKPERFTPYNLNSETHTGLLWVFEGITSYYDGLFLARAGLISTESFLESLAKKITRVQRTPGRLRQNVEQSSFDAWTHLYKQDANSPNAMVSYYAKGSLVALALDLTIRKESGGKHSLDDVVKECWKRFGETGEGMPERGLESVARAVTGLALEDFFARYVRGTAELPLEGLLKTVGIKLRFRQASDSVDAGGKPAKEDSIPPPWLGATLTLKEGASQFAVVRSGSPAELGGIAPGDEAAALDGLRLTAANLDSRLRDHHVGDTVTLTVFRDHSLMRHRVVLGAAPEDTGYLEVDADANEGAEKERVSWVGAS
jgi:predicted metalloprotease with PDZ domain